MESIESMESIMGCRAGGNALRVAVERVLGSVAMRETRYASRSIMRPFAPSPTAPHTGAQESPPPAYSLPVDRHLFS